MDVLQYGYKRCSSTTICTTLLLVIIDYIYIYQIFLLVLDASKAFDRVEYVKLFQTLCDLKNVSYCIEINYASVDLGCQPVWLCVHLLQ